MSLGVSPLPYSGRASGTCSDPRARDQPARGPSGDHLIANNRKAGPASGRQSRWRSHPPCRTRTRAFVSSGQNQIRDHLLPLGLRTKVQCQTPTATADQTADQHWDREPEIVGQGEIGYDWWHQSAQYRPDVIAERRRGRPNLGREPFVHVGWYLRAGTAAEQRPLNDIADHDDPIIGAQHIKERYGYAQQAGNNHRPAPADMVASPAPEHACQEYDRVGEDDRRRDQGRAQAKVLLQVRREHSVDRIVRHQTTSHPPAGERRVADHAALENAKQRHPYLAILGTLEPAVFDPYRRLFDKIAYIDDR